ncbi:hypothetical protein YC2023_042795 [Brassica napus]
MAAMEKGDAGAVLEYFQKKKEDDSSFFTSMQLDEDDMISNIFWADDRSISDYNLFGDVNFLGAMSGKQPQTILTDQCAAMANAIGKVFPETKHSSCRMLQHALDVYTPEVFTLFQKEYIPIGDYVAKRVNKSEMVSAEYNVSFCGVGRNHLVNYVAANEMIHCSCMKFSFGGILCRHALKVLAKKDVRRIPPTYILNRWSKEAKARTIFFYHSATPNDTVKQSIGKRYSHICRTFREIAFVAADDSSLPLDTQLPVAATSLTLGNGTYFSQLLHGFDKSCGGSP